MGRNLNLERKVFNTHSIEEARYKEITVCGTLLGYPPCCLFHFVRAVRRGFEPPKLIGPGPWEGSGFIPCLGHAHFIKKQGFDVFVEREIVPRRIPDLPEFPNCIENDVWAYLERMSHRVLHTVIVNDGR